MWSSSRIVSAGAQIVALFIKYPPDQNPPPRNSACSMKITEDVRQYAEEKALDAQTAIQTGMKEKAEEFKKTGLEIYQ